MYVFGNRASSLKLDILNSYCADSKAKKTANFGLSFLCGIFFNPVLCSAHTHQPKTRMKNWLLC